MIRISCRPQNPGPFFFFWVGLNLQFIPSSFLPNRFLDQRPELLLGLPATDLPNRTWHDPDHSRGSSAGRRGRTLTPPALPTAAWQTWGGLSMSHVWQTSYCSTLPCRRRRSPRAPRGRWTVFYCASCRSSAVASPCGGSRFPFKLQKPCSAWSCGCLLMRQRWSWDGKRRTYKKKKNGWDLLLISPWSLLLFTKKGLDSKRCV